MHERYKKQTLLKGFGPEGQRKLAHASVLMVGAGGLGCPALLYLAAAGIGQIGIIDSDIIDVSNLHRQVLYGDADTGKSKAITAASRLKELNPGIATVAYGRRLEASNVWDIVEPYDVVLDGSDNFATRFVVNDACVLLGKPLVHGAVFRFEGQVGVFNYGSSPASYRDVVPSIPDPSAVADCNEAGVLGVLPGMIGIMMATEAIKIITGIGEVLANKMLLYNALRQSFYELKINQRHTAPGLIPETRRELENMNYEFVCNGRQVREISCTEFEEAWRHGKIQAIDVRDSSERPRMEPIETATIPLPEISDRLNEIDRSKITVVFCATGKRSARAAKLIEEDTGHKEVFSLRGGMEAWQRHLENKSSEPVSKVFL